MTTYTISIGHYTDNIDKKLSGTAFGAVVDTGSTQKIIKHYTQEGSYMDASLEGVAKVLKAVHAKLEAIADPSIDFTIRLKVRESNVHKILSKLGSVFDDLCGFEDNVSSIIDLKLRRKNRTYHETHALQKQIVELMLEINRKCKFTLFVDKVNRSDVSFQIAETHLTEMNQQMPSNVVHLVSR